jgi:hypothetical protein
MVDTFTSVATNPRSYNGKTDTFESIKIRNFCKARKRTLTSKIQVEETKKKHL